jgi:hypothetical protein
MGIERIACAVESGHEALVGAVMRYGVMERLGASSARVDVRLLAFGLGDGELRLVVEGDRRDIANVMRGLKVGTTRAARESGRRLEWSGNVHTPVADDALDRAVAWAHAAPVDAGAPGPLGSPWSSHRDLMGYRHAPFYDNAVLAGRVDPQRVHRLAGGRAAPEASVSDDGAGEPLSLLLRVAAAVRGVLPADRRCFRLFAQLAARRGWTTSEVARALGLTPRRVRQLKAERDPLLPLAMTTLGDARLLRVP